MTRTQLITHLMTYFRAEDQIRLGIGGKALEIDDIGYALIDEATDEIVQNADDATCDHEHVCVLWPCDDVAIATANGERSPMKKRTFSVVDSMFKSPRKKPRKRVKKKIR